MIAVTVAARRPRGVSDLRDQARCTSAIIAGIAISGFIAQADVVAVVVVVVLWCCLNSGGND